MSEPFSREGLWDKAESDFLLLLESGQTSRPSRGEAAVHTYTRTT